jgi:hypothetical protein
MKKLSAQLRAEGLLTQLAELYMEGNPYLGHYAWHWEEERWHELLVCALISAGFAPDLARSVIHILTPLGLSTPAVLANADKGAVRTIRDVLSRIGIADESATAALRALQQTAHVCVAEWNGRPQMLLRQMAEQWAQTLTKQLHDSGMDADMARTLSVLWLQNVANAPLLASTSSAVKEFCRDAGIDEHDLIAAADHVGLNVAILDELMLLRQEVRAATPASTTRKPNKAALRQGTS